MKVCAERKVNLLKEIRFVNSEVHDPEYVERLPREVRHWWISEMQKDRQDQRDEVEKMRGVRKQNV